MTPPFHSSPAYLHFCTYGFTMTCEELIKQGASLSAASAGRRTLGAATEVSLEYFQREREAGLYDGEWPLTSWIFCWVFAHLTLRVGRLRWNITIFMTTY
jgi:hypothetical protein